MVDIKIDGKNTHNLVMALRKYAAEQDTSVKRGHVRLALEFLNKQGHRELLLGGC